MSKNPEQKMKILHVAEFLQKYSTAGQPVSAPQIIEYLADKGIKAERKSIYDDIACLSRFGLEIKRKGGPKGGYYCKSGPLPLQDMKILADAVSVSRFLSSKRTEQLISHMAELLPRSERAELKQKVHVMSRQQNPPEDIYDYIDVIRRALNQNKSITFNYYEWRFKKEGGRLRYVRRLRHQRKRYFVHPLVLLWDDVNYYLVAYENDSEMIRHYRLDRMHRPAVSETDNPAGRNIALRFDPAVYSSAVFDMFSGEEQSVVFLFREKILDAMIDRFGENMIVEQTSDKEWYKTIQNIRVSDRFLAWVLAFGDELRIEGPPSAVRSMKKFLRRVGAAYKIEQDHQRGE